jgi:signal transduction histidine kinase
MRRLPARFDDLRIKHKILAGHIALIVPLGAIVILVAAMGSQILAQSASISRDLVPALANLESVRSTGLDVIETTNTYVVTSLNGAPNTQTRGSRLADAAEAALQARDAFDKAVNGVPPTKSDQGGSTLRQDIAFARDAILAQGGKVASLIADGAPTSVVVQLSDDFTDAAASFRALIDSAIELEQAKLRARQRELDANIWVSIVIVTAFGLAAMGLALAGGHYIAKRIATPILELHDAAVRIGEGSFESLPPNHSRDEVGALVTAFRNMVDQLKDMVERLARQERLATLGQLAGTVGHELRNPLFAITNSLYILREEIRDQTDGTKHARWHASIATSSDATPSLAISWTMHAPASSIAKRLRSTNGWPRCSTTTPCRMVSPCGENSPRPARQWSIAIASGKSWSTCWTMPRKRSWMRGETVRRQARAR